MTRKEQNDQLHHYMMLQLTQGAYAIQSSITMKNVYSYFNVYKKYQHVPTYCYS